METKKDPLRKAKLTYTIELLVFAILFAVLGILILVGVIPVKGTFRKVLIYVSLLGSAWIIVDFFWTLFSQKRRKKNSLLDKILALPAGGSVLVMDILTFIQGFDKTIELHETFVGILFCYLALVYLIEAVYHWKKPVPLILEAAEEERKEKQEKEEEAKQENQEDFDRKLREAQEKRNQKED